VAVADSLFLVDTAVARAATFPRLRYMGSKHKLVPHLAALFHELGGRSAVDAFSGSGVVSYALKSLGYTVTSNDFLAFPQVIADATGRKSGRTAHDG
jgi:adenine-specific DNA-methyltransferase